MKVKLDKNRTLNYRSMYNEQCSCNKCTYYRQVILKKYDKLEEIFDYFGAPAEYPLNITSFYPDMFYFDVVYTIAGELEADMTWYEDEKFSVKLYRNDSDASIYDNNDMEEPYFLMNVLVEHSQED